MHKQSQLEKKTGQLMQGLRFDSAHLETDLLSNYWSTANTDLMLV